MYYYKQVKNGQIVSVEAKSIDTASPDFKKATKAEYDSFIASLPPKPEPIPPRNLEAEIDDIEKRLAELEKK